MDKTWTRRRPVHCYHSSVIIGGNGCKSSYPFGGNSCPDSDQDAHTYPPAAMVATQTALAELTTVPAVTLVPASLLPPANTPVPLTITPASDGGRIAFQSNRDGNWEIYVMSADPSAGSGQGGSGVTRLTNNPAPEVLPSWSPDGTRIAFTSMRDEPDPQNCGTNCNFEIYVMNADGTGVTRLTKGRCPAWSR